MAVFCTCALADIAVATATLFVGVYLYYAHIFRYWKRRGVQDVRPLPVLGNFQWLAFQTESFGEYLKRIYDDHPGRTVVGLFAGRSPFLMVRDLDVVRNVMVKDAHAFLDRPIDPSKQGDPLISKALFFLKGEAWRQMRIKLTPTFTSGKMKKMFHLINECGKELVSCIGQEISKGNHVVVKDVVARYSTDVIASCAFGINSNSLGNPSCEFRTVTRKMAEQTKLEQLIGAVSFFAPWLTRPLGLSPFDEKVNGYVRRTFWDVVEHRKKNKLVRKDFVDILIQIKDEGEVRAEDERDMEDIKQDTKYMNVENSRHKSDIKLDGDDLVAQAFVFIAAGFETSSSVVSFTLYELALNNDVQERLRREMKTTLDKHNSEVTYDAIVEMSYLEMVVAEAMRKYPTVPVLERKCLQDYIIPGTNITIEKGTDVVIPVLGIHMDPTIYPEPDRFNPERFNPVNKRQLHHFSHIPFGEGPRICIGMRFGLMQVKTALVHILTSYKVKACAETPPAPLTMEPLASVSKPVKSIILALEKIK